MGDQSPDNRTNSLAGRPAGSDRAPVGKSGGRGFARSLSFLRPRRWLPPVAGACDRTTPGLAPRSDHLTGNGRMVFSKGPLGRQDPDTPGALRRPRGRGFDDAGGVRQPEPGHQTCRRVAGCSLPGVSPRMAAAGAIPALTMGLASCAPKIPLGSGGGGSGASELGVAALGAPFGWITPVAALAGVAGVALLIASFWLPTLRGLGIAGLIAAVGLGLLQWLLSRYAGLIAVGGLCVALVAGGYWAWGKWRLWQLSEGIKWTHPDAAVALKAAALGKTGANGRDKRWRQEALARMPWASQKGSSA